MTPGSGTRAAFPLLPGSPADFLQSGAEWCTITSVQKTGSGKEGAVLAGQRRNDSQSRRRGYRITTLLLFLVLLAGVGILAYPAFSEYWNSFHSSRAIATYAEQVANLDTEKYQALWESALDFNERLQAMPNRWAMTEETKAAYREELNVSGSGIMGYISIPKAEIDLPIYHGTSDGVLQIAVGHLEGTSLPVGSRHSDEEDFSQVDFGSHCVLSGHRGLPSARLFSDIDMLEVGDTFILNILDQTLTYEVDQIKVIEPHDMTELAILPGRDLCTLFTCTPYGINTHRLLVRGTRIENEKQKLHLRVTADAMRIQPTYVAPFIAVPVLILLVFWVIIITSGPRRRND